MHVCQGEKNGPERNWTLYLSISQKKKIIQFIRYICEKLIILKWAYLRACFQIGVRYSIVDREISLDQGVLGATPAVFEDY